jgi:hypothetical protein
VIHKSADFNGAPRNGFDYPRPRADGDYVANLKRLIGMKRNSGKEIAERVLQSETDNDAEDGGCGDERSKLYFREKVFDDKRENENVSDCRKQIANDVWGFIIFSQTQRIAKRKIMAMRISSTASAEASNTPAKVSTVVFGFSGVPGSRLKIRASLRL